MIFLSIAILLAPIVTRDTMSGVRALQYSSKAGRKIMRIQLFAMITVSAVIAILQIIATYAVFSAGTWQDFWTSGIHSFLNCWGYNWFDGTFGVWIILSAILILGLSLIVALFVFIISKASKNYITLIVWLIPLLVVLIILCNYLLMQPFSVTDYFAIYKYIRIPYAEFYVCGILFLIGMIASGVLLSKQRQAEVIQ
jgi:hypothetical protein